MRCISKSDYDASDDFTRRMFWEYADREGEAGVLRAKNFQHEVGLFYRPGFAIAVVGLLDEPHQRLLARAVVFISGKKAFEHEELYIQFPSNHFKAKVLLATGGGS